MKRLKHLWLKMCVATSMTISNSVLADAEEVFEPLNEKTNELVDQVTLWAASLSLLCIVIFGIATMTGNLSKFWGACIVGGGLIILVGSGLSNFLLT